MTTDYIATGVNKKRPDQALTRRFLDEVYV